MKLIDPVRNVLTIAIFGLLGATAVHYVLFAPAPPPSGPEVPISPYSPRSPVEVRHAYEFAATHADVLDKVPCFCGCKQSGHANNEACFVAARDAAGQVRRWQPHGAMCAMCIDIAHRAEELTGQGRAPDEVASIIATEFAVGDHKSGGEARP